MTQKDHRDDFCDSLSGKKLIFRSLTGYQQRDTLGYKTFSHIICSLLEVSRAEELVNARERRNENLSNRRYADSELIEKYHNDSSALNPDEVSRAEELVNARERKNENQSNRWYADSELIEKYHKDSSALNPDEVSRAVKLVKARELKNEKKRKQYHAKRAAAKDEALRAAAKDLDEK